MSITRITVQTIDEKLEVIVDNVMMLEEGIIEYVRKISKSVS